jgi:F0F1-type ATP synthase assembly protein I
VDLNPFRDLGAREGDGLVMAFELVLSTTIFGLVGWWLDGLLGTRPFLTVVLAAFTLTYTVWRMVTTYGLEMDHHEARRNPLRRGPVR